MRHHANIEEAFERRRGYHCIPGRTPAELTEAWLKCEAELEEISCRIYDDHDRRLPSLLKANVLIPLLIAWVSFCIGLYLTLVLIFT